MQHVKSPSSPTKRGDTPAQAMKRVHSLAKRKATSDPEYDPITLKLKDQTRRKWRITCDTFVLQETQTGRGPVPVLSISRTEDKNFYGRGQFVIDPDTLDVFFVMPATKYNISLLATHLANDLWIIEPDKYREMAEKRWEEIKKEQDVEEVQPVEEKTEQTDRNFYDEAREIVKKDEEFIQRIRLDKPAYWWSNEFKDRVRQVEEKLKEEAFA